MEQNLKGIRLAYIRDPLSTRVLTIASRINENGEVEFGWSANRPDTREYTNTGITEMIYHYKGDPFNKKMGREMALGRLNKATSVVICDKHPEEDSTTAALRFLANPKHKFIVKHGQDEREGCVGISKLAADELVWREKLAFKHPEWQPETGYKAGDVVRVPMTCIDPYANS